MDQDAPDQLAPEQQRRHRATSSLRHHPLVRRLLHLAGRVHDAPAPGHAGEKNLPDTTTPPPWVPLDSGTAAAMCNICRWQGDAFDRPGHCEMALCPGCGSNARDRFQFWCFTEKLRLHQRLRVLECSPRLGRSYRAAMVNWFDYRTTDYDQRAHQGELLLDLQAIDLPDDAVDVMLCAHVLEHVPDTDKALGEIQRVVAPGGRLLLQVPVLQATTAPPEEPEFHGDDTPVFWRFGFDLTARLRQHGFTTDLLCTQYFKDVVVSQSNPWPTWSGEFDLPDMLAGAVAEDLVPVADSATSALLGFHPDFMFLTWDCKVPAT